MLPVRADAAAQDAAAERHRSSSSGTAGELRQAGKRRRLDRSTMTRMLTGSTSMKGNALNAKFDPAETARFGDVETFGPTMTSPYPRRAARICSACLCPVVESARL